MSRHLEAEAAAIQNVAAEQLTFYYEGDPKPVFQELSFTIRQGETVLFLGPSGCGKSTLMYCLNRLYPEAIDGTLKGTVSIGGADIAAYSPGEVCQKVGIVFQDPDSQFCMTRVDEEIAFSLENLGVPREAMDARIDGVLEQVDLTPYRQAKIHTLSGGMRQRLAVACALAANPPVLILDEPTAQLDPCSARELARLMEDLKKRRRLTVLLVEHRLDEWIHMVDRVILLDEEGRCIGAGDPETCFTEQSGMLAEKGVWLPSVTRLAMELRSIGLYESPKLPIREEQLDSGLTSVYKVREYLERSERKPDAEGKKDSGGAPSLSVRDLTVRLGGGNVLSRVHLELEPGQFTAIVGSNGSGKTTLLQQLAGIGEKPVSGEWLLEGHPLTAWKQSELRRRIGYVFQNPEHQFVTFRVFDELAFGMRLRRMPEKTVQAEVGRLMEESGLAGLEEANPFALSQGQKRRLSVATMLADEQSWLLLDEPTFGQDARTSAQLLRLLRERADNGISVTMVSHDMNAVHDYADRVIVLVNGEIRFDGAPRRLWEQSELLAEAGLLPPFRYTMLKRLQETEEARQPEGSHS